MGTKTKNLLKDGTLKHSFYDALLFNKIKRALGLDHVKIVCSGSAPLSENVMLFWRCMLGVPVVEGYGQTEGATGATIAHTDDMTTVGHVGGPTNNCEICLYNVPEMGYLHTNRSHRGEECCGRGEICVRGPNVFKGYYKDEVKTRETVDEEGWLHSGDIGLWTPDGQLKIIDRKKNIFKLSQGEYVAPEKIENIFIESTLISQCFIYGDSYQPTLVGILVPDEDVAKEWSAKQNLQMKFEDLCKSDELRQAVMSEIKRLAKKYGMAGFEVPKAIYLESELFSAENGLLTPTFKLKRRESKEKYKDIINGLYTKINSQSKI